MDQSVKDFHVVRNKWYRRYPEPLESYATIHAIFLMHCSDRGTNRRQILDFIYCCHTMLPLQLQILLAGNSCQRRSYYFIFPTAAYKYAYIICMKRQTFKLTASELFMHIMCSVYSSSPFSPASLPLPPPTHRVPVTVECKYCITAYCSSLASKNSEPDVILVFVQINQPTRCNNFSSLLLDVYIQLNMFRASSRQSSEAQQLQ